MIAFTTAAPGFVVEHRDALSGQTRLVPVLAWLAIIAQNGNVAGPGFAPVVLLAGVMQPHPGKVRQLCVNHAAAAELSNLGCPVCN